MFMSSAKRTDIQSYDVRARNMERGQEQGNGRGVINSEPKTTTPDEVIDLLLKKPTRNPGTLVHCGRMMYGAKIAHEAWDTIQFKFDEKLVELVSLVEEQGLPGWNWEDKYACDTRVEGTFFEVNVPKKKEGTTKIGDAAKGLATPQAATNETTREQDDLRSDSSDHEEEKGKDAGRDAPSASTTGYKNIRTGGLERNLEGVNETAQDLLTPPIEREHVRGEFMLTRMQAVPTMESGPAKTKQDNATKNRTVRDKSQDGERSSWAGAPVRSWAEAAGAAAKYHQHEEEYEGYNEEEEDAQIQADAEFARAAQSEEQHAREMLEANRLRDEAASRKEAEKMQRI
jgi:hypothetical protein